VSLAGQVVHQDDAAQSEAPHLRYRKVAPVAPRSGRATRASGSGLVREVVPAVGFSGVAASKLSFSSRKCETPLALAHR
jgi:hypothetical protein